MEAAPPAEVRLQLQQERRKHPRTAFDEREGAAQQEFVQVQARLVAEVMGWARSGQPRADGGAAPNCTPCAWEADTAQRTVDPPRSVGLGQPIPPERTSFGCLGCEASLFQEEALGLSGSHYHTRMLSGAVRLALVQACCVDVMLQYRTYRVRYWSGARVRYPRGKL